MADPVFQVLIGPFQTNAQFTHSLGSSREVHVPTESVVVWYLFNRWPDLRLVPCKQVGYLIGARTVLWVFGNIEAQRPDAAVISRVNPDYHPQWDLWKPFFDK